MRLAPDADERFFALAEVRDLTPVRDASGRIAHLPQLEHVLHETCASLRLAQARRGASDRLEWNRILLSLAPPFTLSQQEALEIQKRSREEIERWNRELEDRIASRTAEITLRNRQLLAVNSIAAAVSQSFDLEEILGTTLQRSQEALDADAGDVDLGPVVANRSQPL